MMKLSKNFNLSELTRSQEATRKGIDNTPSLTVIDNLQALVDNVLQPIRDELGTVNVSSGYRSPELNKSIGGSPTSDHCKGQAADFEVSGLSNFGTAQWVRDNIPKFTQLILEFPSPTDPAAGWVHVSYDPKDLKNQVLTAKRVNGRVVYSGGLSV